MPPPRIVVFGGTGFLGSHICRAALNRDCLVTSISRYGSPSSPVDPRITFQKADICHPGNYKEILKDAKAVIYSAGILLEGDYKSLARGKWDTRKALGLLGQYKSRNPLEADPRHPRGYDALNRDGAILVAKEAVAAGIKTFAFVSAAANFPGVPDRYITSKREAETAMSQIEGLRSIFIRPGLIFSNHDRPHLAPVKGIISAIAGINSRLGGGLPFVGAAGIAPLDVEVVARAVISATLDPEIKGVVEVETLSKMGTS